MATKLTGYKHLLTCQHCNGITAIFAPMVDHGQRRRQADKTWVNCPMLCDKCHKSGMATDDILLPVFSTPSLFDGMEEKNVH